MLRLEGRLDTTTAPRLESVWRAMPEDVVSLTVDCGKLEYVSSAGLRDMLMMQKKLKDRVRYIRVNKDVEDVFEVTGFSEILNYTLDAGMLNDSLKSSEISIDRCERITVGSNGEVYRIDRETILKLYREDISGEAVDREKTAARSALIAGLPTAISYDIVTCQGRRGVLYEMLKADTLSAKILAEPEKLEENIRLFSDLCKRIHTTKGDASVFSSIADDTVGYINSCDGFTPEQREKMIAHIRRTPDPGTYVHGDLHTNNIMMQNGEPCLIDMGDFSIGSPWYDLAQTYLIYVRLADTGKCRQAVGMEPELSRKVWSLFVKYYFGEEETEETVLRRLKPYLLYRYITASEVRGWRKPREFFQEMYADVEPLLEID